MANESDEQTVFHNDELMPGHEALVKLIREFDIKFITQDATTGEIFIAYHDMRMDPITVLRAKRDNG